MLNKRQAYDIASSWGSYVRTGDPGACFYGLRFNDGRPATERHRAQCLAYARGCLDKARKVTDRRKLQRLVAWFETCDLHTTDGQVMQ